MSTIEIRPTPFDIESVFEIDDYLYFYCESLTDERSDREVAALVQSLELQPPMDILDLACGYGRHANRLAALGYTVTGVDVMPGFLALAEAQAQKLGVKVHYLQADMREISFVEAFDRVMIMFTAFGYFDDADNLCVLENAARALKPGGWLGFDIPNRDTYLKAMRPDIVEEKEGNLMINRQSFDMLTGRFHNQRIVIRDGVRKDKPFSVRLYNATEISSLIAQVGLELRHIYSDWYAQPLSPEARGLVILAQKPV